MLDLTKKYMTRSGKDVMGLQISGGGDIFGKVDGQWYYWYEDGKFSDKNTSEFDLFEKVTLLKDLTAEGFKKVYMEWNRGEGWECWYGGKWVDSQAYTPNPNFAYRKKPVKREVTLVGGTTNQRSWGFYTDGSVDQSYKITFDVVDGKPDFSSVKMESNREE